MPPGAKKLFEAFREFFPKDFGKLEPDLIEATDRNQPAGAYSAGFIKINNHLGRGITKRCQKS